jgi:Ser/Thr protein kinase RdoA (MazF antagonist)
MKRMTKSQALAYMRGWRAVNRFQAEESRKIPVTTRFRQLSMLFFSAKAFAWEKQLAAEDAVAHAWWGRLQKAYLERRS